MPVSVFFWSRVYFAGREVPGRVAEVLVRGE